MSFSEFLTTRIIRIIFIIGIVITGLAAVGLIVGGFADGVTNNS